MNELANIFEPDFQAISHKIQVADLEMENSLLKAELKIAEIRENLRELRERIDAKMHNV